MTDYYVLDTYTAASEGELAVVRDYDIYEYDTRSFLIGPDGFVCVLGESEDCTWNRDGSAVVDKLNEQQAYIEGLEAAHGALQERIKELEKRLKEYEDYLESVDMLVENIG